MKTRNLLAAAFICGGVISVLLALFVVVMFLENRALRAELQGLREEAYQATAEAGRLRTESAQASEERVSLRARLTQLEREAAQAPAEATNPPALVMTGASPRALRIRTYLGSQPVGSSWLVPTPTRTNSATGQTTYEPVVVLDESARGSLVAYKTNVVERDVYRATTVNHHYPWGYPYNYGWWPAVWVAGTNQNRVCPPQPSPHPPPVTKPMPEEPGVFFPRTVWKPSDNLFMPSLPKPPPTPLLVRAGSGGVRGTPPQSRMGPTIPPANATVAPGVPRR
jgi:hypothetical protein